VGPNTLKISCCHAGVVLTLVLAVSLLIAPRSLEAQQDLTIVRTISVLDAEEVNAVSFSPDGTWIAGGIGDGTVRIWNVSDGKLVKKVKVQARTMHVTFSPDGSTLATADMGPISLLRTSDAQVLIRLPAADGKEEFLNGLAFSPDGQLVVAITNKATTLWRVSDGKLIRSLARGDFSSPNYSPGGYSVDFSSDGQTIFADGERIKAWRVSDGKLVRFLGGSHGYERLAVDSAGRIIAAGTYGSIELLPVNEGGSLCTLQAKDMFGGCEALAFSPNGQFLASSNLGETNSPDEKIRLWDVNKCQLITAAQKFPGSYYRELAFSPDGTLLAVPGKASQNRIGIRLFRIAESKVARDNPPGTSDADWETFWSRFRSAMLKKSIPELRTLMSDPFDAGGELLSPDLYFKFNNDPLSWRTRQKSIASGTKVLLNYWRTEGGSARTTSDSHLIFVRGTDSRWRWAGVGGH
jgi:WD40 repeat protein